MTASARTKKCNLIKKYMAENPKLTWKEAEAKAIDYLHLHGYFPSLGEIAKKEMLEREVKLVKTLTQALIPAKKGPEPSPPPPKSKKKSQPKVNPLPVSPPPSQGLGIKEEINVSLNTAPRGVGGEPPKKKSQAQQKKEAALRSPSWEEKNKPPKPLKDVKKIVEDHPLNQITDEIILDLIKGIGEKREVKKARAEKKEVDQILREHGLPALPTPPPPDETITNAQEISEDLYCHYLLSLVKNGDPDIRIAVELRNFLDKKEKLAPDKPEYEKIDLDIFAAEADAYLCQHKD
jgi:hypothetical protein